MTLDPHCNLSVGASQARGAGSSECLGKINDHDLLVGLGVWFPKDMGVSYC